jgi:hypothetical protein
LLAEGDVMSSSLYVAAVLVSAVDFAAVVPTTIAQRRFTLQAEPASQRVGAPTGSADGLQR